METSLTRILGNIFGYFEDMAETRRFHASREYTEKIYLKWKNNEDISDEEKREFYRCRSSMITRIYGPSNFHQSSSALLEGFKYSNPAKA